MLIIGHLLTENTVGYPPPYGYPMDIFSLGQNPEKLKNNYCDSKITQVEQSEKKHWELNTWGETDKIEEGIEIVNVLSKTAGKKCTSQI